MGYLESNYAVGKSLHQEYEAKYAPQIDFDGDQSVTSFKLFSTIGTMVTGFVMAAVSLFG